MRINILILTSTLFGLLINSSVLFSQGLFSNGNFESYSSCPTGLGQINKLNGVTQCSISSDYYNCSFSLKDVYSCYPVVTGTNGPGFVGMFGGPWDSNSSQYETAIITLDNPTVIGKTYDLNFDLYAIDAPYSPCSKVGYNSCMRYGFYFFKSSAMVSCPSFPIASGTDPAPNVSIEAANITTNSWNSYTLTYTADDVYDRVLFGFFTNANTFTSSCYNTDPTSYILIDNLCIDEPGNNCIVCSYSIDPMVNQEICSTNDVILSANVNGAISTTWSTNGDGSFADASLQNTTYSPGPNDILNGSVTLTITTDDPAGACQAISEEINIIILLPQNLNIDDPGLVCESGEEFNLTCSITGGIWSGNGILDPLYGLFSPQEAGDGTWTIEYTLANSCNDSGKIEIEVIKEDNAQFAYENNTYCIPEEDPSPIINGNEGGVFSINNNGIIDVLSGIINLNESGVGNYIVTYTTNGFCPSSSQFEVEICADLSIEIPNVFTPNDDSKNDLFFIKTQGIKNINAFIYNRWQTLIVHSEIEIGTEYNETTVWDGKMDDGKVATTGTYYYLIELTDSNDNKTVRKGSMELLK